MGYLALRTPRVIQSSSSSSSSSSSCPIGHRSGLRGLERRRTMKTAAEFPFNATNGRGRRTRKTRPTSQRFWGFHPRNHPTSNTYCADVLRASATKVENQIANSSWLLAMRKMAYFGEVNALITGTIELLNVSRRVWQGAAVDVPGDKLRWDIYRLIRLQLSLLGFINC
jgi:hypothetical protein